MGQKVTVIVRPSAKIPDSWIENEKVKIIKADISKISEGELANYTKDCKAIISCLGHNLTLKGIWGKPQKLVTNAYLNYAK